VPLLLSPCHGSPRTRVGGEVGSPSGTDCIYGAQHWRSSFFSKEERLRRAVARARPPPSSCHARYLSESVWVSRPVSFDYTERLERSDPSTLRSSEVVRCSNLFIDCGANETSPSGYKVARAKMGSRASASDSPSSMNQSSSGRVSHTGSLGLGRAESSDSSPMYLGLFLGGDVSSRQSLHVANPDYERSFARGSTGVVQPYFVQPISEEQEDNGVDAPPPPQLAAVDQNILALRRVLQSPRILSPRLVKNPVSPELSNSHQPVGALPGLFEAAFPSDSQLPPALVSFNAPVNDGYSSQSQTPTLAPIFEALQPPVEEIQSPKLLNHFTPRPGSQRLSAIFFAVLARKAQDGNSSSSSTSPLSVLPPTDDTNGFTSMDTARARSPTDWHKRLPDSEKKRRI
jgi:hypothetical protein